MSATITATTPSTAVNPKVATCWVRRSGSNRRTVAAGTVSTTVTSSAPTASIATTTATATATSSARSASAVFTPPARAVSTSKPVASHERRRNTEQTNAAAAAAAVSHRSSGVSAISDPNSSRSTPAPDSYTSLASTTPTASAATSNSPMAASGSIRLLRCSRSSTPPNPIAHTSAVSCAGTPHGPATTSPGNVAVPIACV